MRKLYSEDKPEGLKYWVYTSSSTYLLNKEHSQLLLGSMHITDIFDMRTCYTYNLTSSMYSEETGRRNYCHLRGD